MSGSGQVPADEVAWVECGEVTDLARRAAAGDRAALDGLFRRYAPAVYALALAHVPHHDAHDVVQEVFLRASRGVRSLREPAGVGAWLMAIARNEAVNVARAGRRRSRLILRLVSRAPSAPVRSAARAGPDDGHEPDQERVLECIRELPEAYRETLALRLIAGLSGPRIALVMGMTHASVRVNLHRGMEKLRESLGSTR